jgi:hypothetical protein
MQQHLIDKLPLDVVMNHIIPFTYDCQPKMLLVDIRSFVRDRETMDAVFFINYNPNVLIYDLMCFCNQDIIPICNAYNFFAQILRRNILLRSRDISYMESYIYRMIYQELNRSVEQKIKFIWGLLLPIERTRFLNIYLENRYDY